jgi:hypothetical protein
MGDGAGLREVLVAEKDRDPVVRRGIRRMFDLRQLGVRLPRRIERRVEARVDLVDAEIGEKRRALT